MQGAEGSWKALPTSTDGVALDDLTQGAADSILSELLLQDITAATHGDPARRMPSAAILANDWKAWKPAATNASWT